MVFVLSSSILKTFGQNRIGLDQYNIVWTTQSQNSSESMLCGGGDIGLNVWVEKGGILFYLSRSGAFDENNVFPKFGRVRLKISPNPFDQGVFKQELKLKEGYVEISGTNTLVKIWVDVFKPVINVETESNRPVTIEAIYENWRINDLEWTSQKMTNASLGFRDVEYCEMSNCKLTNSGSAGVRLDLHAQSNVIKNNLIDYVCGKGILLCGYGPGKLNVNKSNKILNNQIHHCGEFYFQSNGIMVWQSGENIIQNNKLHHLPYDSIVLSGTRHMFFQLNGENREQVGTLRTDEIAPEALNQDDTTTYNFSNFVFYQQWPKIAPYYHAGNNLVEDNEVFLVMQKCFDGNAIYLSDVGDRNQIKRNYIHHLNGVGMQQAIRTDAF